MEAELEEIMWTGQFVTAKRRGKWEYVTRSRGIKAAVILAVEDGHVLLVEQYRVPLGSNCLELPAGLIGDNDANEGMFESAARELEEETGYRADRLEDLGAYYSSPGMLGESFNLVRAHGLTQVSEGGGVDGEDIIVHRFKMTALAAFIVTKRDEGCAIDATLLMVPEMSPTEL